MEDKTYTYVDCNSAMPPERYDQDAGLYGSDKVRVIIKNVGGGVTTYEEGYDWTYDGIWIDGDGSLGRTTIAWAFIDEI